MEIGGLSFIGLLLATATSVANVLTDVTRKKALREQELLAASAWIKGIAALVYGLVFFTRWTSDQKPALRDSGPLFGVEAFHFSPLTTFLIYLALDITGVACATLLYFRALQTSPLSLCMPFIAFTPLFLIPTGYLLLGELPSSVKLLGVALVVIGSLVMHRDLFAVGWLEPVRAILRERGSRYMLIVAFLFSLTNPLDAKLVRMSDAYTLAFAYGLSLFLIFGVAAIVRKADWRRVIRSAWFWIIAAGALETVVNLLQFSTHEYIPVVITISLKRAGIVLAVLLGWLIFKEKDVRDKLIASTVMAAGALLFYLPLTELQALALAGATLAGLAAALHLTRNESKPKPNLLEMHGK